MSKLHRIIAQCPVPPPKRTFANTSKKPLIKLLAQCANPFEN